MRRLVLRVVVAVAFVTLGYAAGRAQTPQADFEISVDAPVGETTITCVRGCNLAWVERGVNSNATPGATFKYFCKGTERCASGRVGGWIAR